MKNLLIPALGVLLSLGASCGKKNEAQPAAGGGAGAGAPASGGGAPSPSGAAAPSTAAGGEVAATAAVTECPKSLQGHEAVHRVIGKACGVVPVTGDYSIDGGSLTLEAGSKLAFKEGSRLELGYTDTAKLTVKGTAEEPVLMTTSGDKVAGVWRGIRLHDHADRSSIDHLVIEYAGDEDGEAIRIDAKDVVLKGSTVRESKGVGVRVAPDVQTADLSGNTFDKIGKASLSVGPLGAGGLGAGNKFPEGAVIEVVAGHVGKSATWKNAGAPYALVGEVAFEGDAGSRAVLELAPSVEVRLAPDARLTLGYSSPAGLKAVGQKDAPITFTASGEKKPGGWQSVRVFNNAEATFENVVFEYGGSSDGEGALRVDGAVSLKDSTFRHNVVGLQLGNTAKVKLVDGNKFEDNGKGAITLFPAQYAGLGAGNTYDAGSKIELEGGDVPETATWHAQGALTEVLNSFSVNMRGTLTIEAGSKFAMKDGTKIEIGYSENAGLRLAGTPDKPVTFVGIRDEAGSWDRIQLHGASRDSVLENVVLRDAGGDGGVRVEGGANAKISNLTCSKCAGPALTYVCDAKVTAADIKAADGTPKGEEKPECK